MRNLRHAQLVHGSSFDETFNSFRDEGLDALASLTPKLLSDAARWPGSRILDGRFMSIQQAAGTSRQNTEAAAFLQGFVEEVKSSGLVAEWIGKHRVQGLSVAPAAAR